MTDTGPVEAWVLSRPYHMERGWSVPLPEMLDQARKIDAQMAALTEAAQAVMDLLEEHGPSIVAHLLDDDDNPGERLREALRSVKEGEG